MPNEFGRSIWVGWEDEQWMDDVEPFTVIYSVGVYSKHNGLWDGRWFDLDRFEYHDSGDDWVMSNVVFGVDDGINWRVIVQPNEAFSWMLPPNGSIEVSIHAQTHNELYDAQEDSVEVWLNWNPYMSA